MDSLFLIRYVHVGTYSGSSLSGFSARKLSVSAILTILQFKKNYKKLKIKEDLGKFFLVQFSLSAINFWSKQPKLNEDPWPV